MLPKIVLLLFLILVVIFSSTSQPPTNTTRTGKLKPRTFQITDCPDRDQCVDSVATDSLIINNYDKPLRSLHETFFLTNRYSSALSSITVKLTYYDHDNLMFHSRTVTIPCHIPANETRQLSIIAWDKQYAFYYHDTRITPQKVGAVPYSVIIEPKTVTFSPEVPDP